MINLKAKLSLNAGTVIQNMSQQEKDKFIEITNDIISVLEKLPMGKERVESLKELDTHIKINQIPSCKKGCSHCCYMKVSVMRSEAMVLAEHIRTNPGSISMKRLRRQAKAKTVKEWQQLSFPDQRCVFLKENLCTVYDDRPIACRYYFVVSDPELCRLDNAGRRGTIVTNITATMHHAIELAFASLKDEQLNVGAETEPMAFTILEELLK